MQQKMMFTTIILLLFGLLNLASLRSLAPEDICEQEKNTWNKCYGEFMNGMETTKQEEENSTVPPGDRVTRNFKNMSDCVGDVSCKGQIKFDKFQLDTLVFAIDHVRGGGACIGQADETFQLVHCIFDYTFIKKEDYNGEILTCTKEILDTRECSSEEKMSIMKGARAQNDFIETAFVIEKNKWKAEDFDETFDPNKYN